MKIVPVLVSDMLSCVHCDYNKINLLLISVTNFFLLFLKSGHLWPTFGVPASGSSILIWFVQIEYAFCFSSVSPTQSGLACLWIQGMWMNLKFLSNSLLKIYIDCGRIKYVLFEVNGRW